MKLLNKVIKIHLLYNYLKISKSERQKLNSLERNNISETFLKNYFGDENFERLFLAADASFRRYELITSLNQKYVLMDAPPVQEKLDEFIQIDQLLLKLNLSSPEIYHIDRQNGFLLMEYLGDKKLNKIKNKVETECYIESLNLLVKLKNNYADYKQENIPKYSKDILIKESELFFDWYVIQEKNYLKDDYNIIISNLIDKLEIKQEVLTLRDYHADNILWLDDRSAIERVGLLDFQDALIGNPAYDVVSLLEDARKDVPDQLAEKCISHYIEKSELNEAEFLNDYYILGAQRNLKIIGIFSRLAKRDGKTHYLEMIPRVKNYLLNDLKHPTLLELKIFLEENRLI